MTTIRTLGLGSLLGATGVLAAGLAMAGPEAGAAPSSCRIDVNRTAAGVELAALVRADRTITGSYRFTASKVGGGNASRIDQSGEFAGTGGWTSVGEIELGGGGVYEARLVIDIGGRTMECRERAKGRV